MTKAIVGINEQTVRHTAHYLPVTDHLIALRIQSVVMESENGGEPLIVSERTQQLVCPEEAVETFLKGLDYRCEKDIVLMTDDLLAIYRREGFLYPSEIHSTPKDFGATEDDLLALEYPYDAMEKDLKLTPVHLDFSGHVLFHPEKDEIYPFAINLEYIDGNFSNEKYDLQKALKHLEGRSDVRINKDASGNAIMPIPYYNASAAKSESMSVTYMPDYEMANKLWQASKKIDRRFPTCQFDDAIDVLDALGLIEAGIMKDSYIQMTASLQEAIEADDDGDDEIEDLEEE